MSTQEKQIGRPQKKMDMFASVVGHRLKQAQVSSGMSYREIEEAIHQDRKEYAVLKSSIKFWENAERDYRTEAFEILAKFYSEHTDYSIDWIKANDFRSQIQPLLAKCIDMLAPHPSYIRKDIITLDEFLDMSKEYNLDETEVRLVYPAFADEMKEWLALSPKTIDDSEVLCKFDSIIDELSELSFDADGINTTSIQNRALYRAYLEEMIRGIIYLYTEQTTVTRFCEATKGIFKWYSDFNNQIHNSNNERKEVKNNG